MEYIAMGDWNKIVTGRLAMRRARPLMLAMNALRRQKEEMERRPGINPGGGRGGQFKVQELGKGPRGGKILICSWEEVGHSQCPHRLMPSESNPIPNHTA